MRTHWTATCSAASFGHLEVILPCGMDYFVKDMQRPMDLVAHIRGFRKTIL
jgi:hypothetical protein